MEVSFNNLDTKNIYVGSKDQLVSSLEKKTHRYVITGGLLVGVAACLSAAALTIGLIVMPLLLVGLIPIAVGLIAGSILLHQGRSKHKQAKKYDQELPSFIHGQPVGLKNNGGADCWLNSLMQIAMVIPEVEELFQDIESFDEFTKEYHDSQDHALIDLSKKSYLARVNVESVRKGLANHYPNLIKPRSETNHALDVFNEILKDKTNSSLQIRVRRNSIKNTDRRALGQEIVKEETTTEENRPIFRFDPQYIHNAGQNKELKFGWLSYFFTSKTQMGSEDGATVVTSEQCYFQHHSPQTLIFDVSGLEHYHAENGCGKNFFSMPESFDLPSELIQDSRDTQNSYACSAFLIDAKGHFLSCIKKDGKWYLTDDQIVTIVSPSELAAQMSRGSLFFYQKS